MTVKHTYTTQIVGDTGAVWASSIQDITGTTELECDLSIAGEGDSTWTHAIDVSNIVSMFMIAPAALVVTVNDDGTPDVTINLVAGVPFFWKTGMASPWTVDVTSIKFTNALVPACPVHCAWILSA